MRAFWIEMTGLALALGAVLAVGTQGAEPAPGFLALSPLPPLAASAQPWPASMLGPIPGRSYLPGAVIGPPRLAGSDKQQPIFPRPATDRPGLAWDTGLAASPPYLKPAGPLAYAASPDVSRLTPPWREMAADPAGAEVLGDPVQVPARHAVLAKTAEIHQQPAPFVKLSRPDPLEYSAVIRLPKPLPENDGPAPGYATRPRPLLPVLPPPAKK